MASAALQRDFPPNASYTDISDTGSPTSSKIPAPPNIVHVESSASGLGGAPTSTPRISFTVPAPHLESSASSLDNGPGPIVSPLIPHVESSVSEIPHIEFSASDSLGPNSADARTTVQENSMQTEPYLTTTVPLPTSAFPAVAGSSAPAITAPSAPVVTLGSAILTANSATQFVVGSQTLQPGGPAITISGTTLSLAPSATAIVVNGATSSLDLPAVAGGGHQVIATTLAPALTIDGTTYTANSASGFVIAPGTTLTPGGAVTLSGTVLSLDTSGTALLVGTSASAVGVVTAIVTITTPGIRESGIVVTSGDTAVKTAVAPSSVETQGGAKSTTSSAAAGSRTGGGRGTGTVGRVRWIECWLVGFAVLA